MANEIQKLALRPDVEIIFTLGIDGKNLEEDRETLYNLVTGQTIDFLNAICLVWSTATHDNERWYHVSSSESAGFPRGVKFLWRNEEGKTCEISANNYCMNVLIWVEKELENEAVFPTSTAASYPDDFISQVKNIWTKLFRVLIVLFSNECLRDKFGSDFQHIVETDVLKPFLFVGWRFNLLNTREVKILAAWCTPLYQEFLEQSEKYMV